MYTNLLMINLAKLTAGFFLMSCNFFYVMVNLLVIINPLKTYLYGQTNFRIEIICFQHLLIECLDKYNFLKIPDANSIFANMKLIIKLSRQHFFHWYEMSWVRKTALSQCGMVACCETWEVSHLLFDHFKITHYVLISETDVLAGCSDQIKTVVFAKLYSFFPSICISWFICFWKQNSWVTFSVLFRTG